MNTFSAIDRQKLLESLPSEQFDLVIIGGGVTGCGIALDAASRGLKTLLVEKQDFASGTSSRSTKLIHGGLRYLKQFEIALVREVGMERAKVHRIAPHLVTSEKMLLPIIKGGTFGKLLTSVGLMVYDILAGVEKADKRKMLTKEETLEAEPMLPEELVEGAGLYAEYRTDDARLTVEIAKTAAGFGAKLFNYIMVEDFLYGHQKKLLGVQCRDLIRDVEILIQAKYVVNAAGPWVDELRDKDRSLEGKRLFLSKGVHLVVPHERFPVKQAVYFDVPDGRMIFAIPRGRITYIGTTDTPYDGSINKVKTTPEDAQYLIGAVNNMFPLANLKKSDVESSWAGLRPLIHEEGKRVSEISRKDEIFESPSGLISIAGGKLTGYRKMAQKVVDLVAKKYVQEYEKEFSKCFTHKIELTGGPFDSPDEVDEYIDVLKKNIRDKGLKDFYAEYLVGNYGKQSDIILKKMNAYREGSPEVNFARAELWFAVHCEMVHKPLDFFSRRTGRLYFLIDTIPETLDPLLSDFQKYFGWKKEQIDKEREIVDRAISEAKIIR